MQTENVFSIQTVMSKFKSKRHFHEAYTQQGKLMIDLPYVSWHYIGEILTGQKLVISIADVKDFQLPPRFKNLNVKQLWTEHSNDKQFVKYFPDMCLLRVPPADYFWKVFSVAKRPIYERLIKDKLEVTKSQRKIHEESLVLTEEAIQILQKTNFDSQIDMLLAKRDDPRRVISLLNRPSKIKLRPGDLDMSKKSNLKRVNLGTMSQRDVYSPGKQQ